MKLGQEQEATLAFEKILQVANAEHKHYSDVLKGYAIAYLRMGERQNCISNHSSESCIMPIKDAGVHQNKTGSRKAIEIYQQLLKEDNKKQL